MTTRTRRPARALFTSIALLLLISSATVTAMTPQKFLDDMQSGEVAINQRKYEAAVDAFKDALRSARTLEGEPAELATARANFGLSRAYMGLGAFKNAIQSCDEALKHSGTSKALEAVVRNQRGAALVASVFKFPDPKLEDALTDFRAVRAITNQDPMVTYNIGVTLLKLGRDAEGIRELQDFVVRGNRAPEIATALSLIDQPRRARETFAPEFSLTTVDGELIRLKDLKGKVVLIDFWGTWCPPCRESTPSLVRYAKKHPSEAFVIISVAVNEPSEGAWRDYIEKNKMTSWPQYLDSTRKITALFKVTGFPTYIVLDEDGVVRDRRMGWNPETMSSIDDKVKKALKARN